MIRDKLEHTGNFSAESDLPGKFYVFLNVIASGLKGVLKNSPVYSNLSTNNIYF